MTNKLSLEEINSLLLITLERIKVTNPLSENELLNHLVVIQQKLLSQKLELQE